MTRKKYTQEELVKNLCKVAKELGRSPTMNEISKREDCPHHSTYVNRFGSWTCALKTAELESGTRPSKIPKDKLLSQLRQVANNLGRPPTIQELDEKDNTPNSSTYITRFGTWITALERAGLETKYSHERRAADQRNKELSDEQLLDDLESFAARLNHTPTVSEMTEYGPHQGGLYRARFGGWNNALTKAGITPSRQRELSDRELLDEITRLAERYGEPPTTTLMSEEGKYSMSVYYDHFDSWNDALRAAGNPVQTERRGRKTNVASEKMSETG